MSRREQQVLILSGSIGAGHDAVSEACAGGLESVGAAIETLDCMDLLGNREHQIGERAFRTILGWPPLYDAFHFNGLRAGSRIARLLDDQANRRIVPAVEARLDDYPAGGLLLGVFATGAGAASRITQRRPTWRSVVFCTDATAHRMWVHPGIDRYLVCSPVAAATVRSYDPTADIVELPPPVRREFFTAPSKTAARERLALDPTIPWVMLAAGGWGLGPIGAAATHLANAGIGVLAVAGHNAKLEQTLRNAAMSLSGRAANRIVPFGFTDRMPELMAAADVVITAPGQTCHEARVVDRPLAVLDIVPGHGRENLLLELTARGAVAVPGSPELITRSVMAVLDRGAGATEPWPVNDADEWQKAFLSAVSDLLVPEVGDTAARE